MLTPQRAAMYGWVTIGVLVVLLLLVWTNAVDPVFRLPILIFAILLVVSRVVLRMITRRREGESPRDRDPG